MMHTQAKEEQTPHRISMPCFCPSNRGKHLLLAFALLLLFHCLAGNAAAEETLKFGRFGEVTLYRDSPTPANVVLFVSGDGGWNLGVIDMAKSLAGLNALVVGIDIVHYLKETGRSQEKCTYWAADFEELSHYVQKKLNLPRYLPPTLVGYSSGATLVYATLAQAPAGTFAGAISLGFCPDLTLMRPPCGGAGLKWQPGRKSNEYFFQPRADLQPPWIALQGEIDQVCDSATAQGFVNKTGKARAIMLPNVGHGFSVQGNWLPQFKDAFRQIASVSERPGPLAQSVADLPLVEVPATAPGKIMAVMISGDGGWAGIDRELADYLAARGANVVGLNALQYFWHHRTPEEAARDLERILAHYTGKWQPERLVLIGYSFGAEVLPFMVSRLPPALAQKIHLLALLTPGTEAEFEIHVGDWFGMEEKKGAWPVAAEIKKLTGPKILCLYGSQEQETVCTALDGRHALGVELRGGHHLGGEYGPIADRILQALP